MRQSEILLYIYILCNASIENEIGPKMFVVYADKNKTGLKVSIGGGADAAVHDKCVDCVSVLCVSVVC